MTCGWAPINSTGTWQRESFYLRSTQSNPRNHHDTIDIADFPRCWLQLDTTIEVEAKGKELAVLKLMKDVLRLSAEKSA
ncbi:hypothetical protein ACFLZE_03275 [Thermodesulfobacteriota bacterium]